MKDKTVNFTLTLVGMTYRMSKPERLQLNNLLESEGELACTLDPEPENPVDPKAVRVFADGGHIGYVARPANEPLFDLLAKGATITFCVLTELDPFAGEGELQVELVRPGK